LTPRFRQKPKLVSKSLPAKPQGNSVQNGTVAPKVANITKRNISMQNESIDTNLLVRFVTNDVPKLRIKVVKLLAKPNTTYHVADLAILEMVYVLSIQTHSTRNEITHAINLITSQKNIKCNRALFNEALPLYANHPALNFNDCCLAVYAKLNQSEPLWTFDKKLAVQTAAAKLVT
jgi:predicted nucleic-acid-binding protein